MSRTLFVYIFRDLIRIFFLASGVLAGIMSFGGLLRPLTEHGLDAQQAVKMLSYFMPAMTTYSLPIAALFATTVVYGRLAADNEITAMRSAGISWWPLGGIAMPACVLGLLVALISLLFLCFIVPIFSLKVEQVVYSNLAEMISNEIERTHQIKFGKETTIFAQQSAVAPSDPKHPNEQMVRLGGMMIVSYRKQDAPAGSDLPALQIPREFYLAKQATVFIHRDTDGEVTMEARLEPPGGAMFPRQFVGAESLQGGLASTQYGPFPIESPIREQPKFMDIRRLHELYLDLGKSRRVQEKVQDIVRSMQEQKYLESVAGAMRKAGGTFNFNAGDEQYELVSPKGGVSQRGDRLVITPGRLIQLTNGKPQFTWDAAEIELGATPIPGDLLSIEAQFRDVVAQTPEGPTARPSFGRNFTVSMPRSLENIADNDVEFFRTSPGTPHDERMALQREIYKVGNSIQSEMHSRASFAISCLILVMVGCALGMMFRTGNFLNAFALSVVPALTCIALIVAGQHTCENVPWKLVNFHNPLNLGLALIWSGNAVVLVLAIVLGARLQKQ
jgi:lipopolysaccharide export LptBFGC system permease protein LptF